MKALTISQPFAKLIADGTKWVENRTWATKYRGQLAIHAGSGTQYLTKAALRKFQSGGVIATGVLVDIVSMKELEKLVKQEEEGGSHRMCPLDGRSWRQVLDHYHTEGPYCWLLADVERCEFDRISGCQGLCEWDPNRERHVV